MEKASKESGGLDQDKVIEELRDAAGWLAKELALSHRAMLRLLIVLDGPELSVIQGAAVEVARRELTLRQNEFLKKFGDLAEPGKNQGGVERKNEWTIS